MLPKVWPHISKATRNTLSCMAKYLFIFSLLCIWSWTNTMGQNLPEVFIHNDSTLETTWTTGYLTFVDDGDTMQFPIQMRHRGATSLKYDKPSLAIKLFSGSGKKQDVSFLGMREDNYWILDAMAVDKARMRNRVTMDLWKEIAPPLWYADLEPKAQNTYNGQMISVVLDDREMGIYCLQERIDRKQLKLKKYSSKNGIRGALYKTVSWSNSVSFQSIPSPHPTTLESEWDSWEVKYPDIDDGEPITWQPLLDLLQFVCYSNATQFANSITDYIDLPTYSNYILLVQLLSLRDNCGKNNYWSFYDISKSGKATISLWDTDHSWGRMYNSQPEGTEYLVSNSLIERLYACYPSFSELVEQRWAHLRQSSFRIEHLDSLCAKYFTLYQQTGMDIIESKLWNGHNGIDIDIPSEQMYIHNWLVKRLAFLDSHYHYSPIADDTDSPVSNHNQAPVVFDIFGHIVAHSIENLPKGIYIYQHNGKIEKILIP